MPIEPLYNEALLVQAMQGGSEEAFTALYHHYSPRLYLNMLHMTRDPVVAEEIIQELFTRIWQKRTNKGIAENFPGYVFRTGQHLVLDFFRKLKRDRKLLEKFSLLAGTPIEGIEEILHNKQTSAILKKAIDALSPRQKKVYELVKLEGYPYKEAAVIMGISPLTVKEYLVAANKSIRNYLMTHADDPLVLFLLLTICTGLV